MLNKSSWNHVTFNCVCLIGSGLCCLTTIEAQTQQRPSQGQPAGAQPGGTPVKSKQLQQMFQTQSAQNQAAARQSAGQTNPQPGQQQFQPQQQLPTGQPGQPATNPSQFGQGQPGTFQRQLTQAQQGQLPQGQLPQGQLPQGQPAANQGQFGQAQNAQTAPNNGQNPTGPVPLTPEQAAAVALAQEQALAGGGVNPVAPFPPLNKEWTDYLDKVLTKWESESSKVQKFQCEFKRYQYDPTLIAAEHYTFAQGELKYMQPDKGLFKVNALVYHAGKDEKGQPKYEPNPKKEFGEYWICDGENVHLLDRNEKVCTIYQLPPNMRGAGIQASPLPFVFGVKKQDLMARYWINPLPQPKDRNNEIWLEVFPRRADDASNYLKLQVVLDMRDWMPMGLIVFMPNWRPNAQHRELYQFDKRVVNASNILPQLFQKEFIPAKPPADWKVIQEKYQEPQAQQPADQPRVAQPPQTTGPVLK